MLHIFRVKREEVRDGNYSGEIITGSGNHYLACVDLFKYAGGLNDPATGFDQESLVQSFGYCRKLNPNILNHDMAL